MGVLENLRIKTENDQEYDTEYESESDEEYGEESDPNIDPSPGQAAPRPAPRKKSTISQVREMGPRVTKRARDEAQAEIQSIVEVIALGWGLQAPPCGDALEAAAPAFAEKLTRIVARNPRWLQRVRDGGLIADIIACAGTLTPVARTAYAHYSTPREASHGGAGVEFHPDQFPAYDGTGFSRAS